MKKKVIILIITLIVAIIGVICISTFGINWLFSEQYNEKGGHWGRF